MNNLVRVHITLNYFWISNGFIFSNDVYGGSCIDLLCHWICSGLRSSYDYLDWMNTYSEILFTEFLMMENNTKMIIIAIQFIMSRMIMTRIKIRMQAGCMKNRIKSQYKRTQCMCTQCNFGVQVQDNLDGSSVFVERPLLPTGNPTPVISEDVHNCCHT